MHNLLAAPFKIGSLILANRLIQGPLAGYSCAPFRALFSQFSSPAYCVSEMLSATDVLTKHKIYGRYLYRAAEETTLCYQIAGTDPAVMAAAAIKLQELQADLIDINCGCPKAKIRKKGAGSALLEQPNHLISLVDAVRQAIKIPLTVKIRLLPQLKETVTLAKRLADAGIDALIVHGRKWQDDYDVACNLEHIALIKNEISIPVIANGDLKDKASLLCAFNQTHCDAFMISRAGTGKPWLFQTLLTDIPPSINNQQLIALFMQHVIQLANLESEYQALLQSRSLLRYYFKDKLSHANLADFFKLTSLSQLSEFLIHHLS